MTSRWRALAQTLRTAGLPRFALRWPSQCWVCGAWPSAPVCGPCVTALGQPRPRCLLCALPLATTRICPTCRITPPLWTSCHAALDYDFPWDRCIALFKFGDQPGMARALAALMWHAPGIAPTLEQAELVVPMPLSRERLRTRGYNQAHELARELVRHLRPRGSPRAEGFHSNPHVLHRLRNTEAQSTLEASARQSNLHQAFQVLPADRIHVQGRRVVVVDDIMTTGASLQEATRALLHAGALSVTGVVLARTPAVS